MEAHSGLGAPQSAHKLLLGSAQIRSATSRFDKASPIALRIASTHCSRTCSDSAIKLRTETNARPSINADMLVSMSTIKWRKWETQYSSCVSVCVFPFDHGTNEVYWQQFFSGMAKNMWAKDWKLQKHTCTHTHTHRLVAWRRLSCLITSSSYSSNGTLPLKWKQTQFTDN